MPLTTYRPKKFSAEHQRIIDAATTICESYSGMALTLRQVYYQFVARGLVENNQANYKRIGDILNQARLAGEFDWEYMVDRTRNLVKQPSWKSPAELVESAAKQFKIDLWKNQHQRIEVWIEKDAAIGVIEAVCNANDVPYFSCRGYASQSEMWEAGNRLRFHLEDGDKVTILHIGDHDPSGLDMTRDNTDRLRMFIHQDWAAMNMGWGSHTRGAIKASMRDHMRSKGSEIEDWEEPWTFKRIALNWDQVQQYEPPPNFAKVTDSRATDYVNEFGDSSWELDALDPNVLQTLISDEINEIRDDALWDDALVEMHEGRATLKAVAENWAAVADFYKPKEA